jgi:hypothetical protein
MFDSLHEIAFGAWSATPDTMTAEDMIEFLSASAISPLPVLGQHYFSA